ncbi:MAG: type IV pili methyl-accepting chemotaxis transducer N-terminal domain-containing protein [Chloroflexi bacterium]|nr:type IV pili methyl-accepting chemotaxis transducer N-terminal domain-containing protein [Chloroflexota bacterium]
MLLSSGAIFLQVRQQQSDAAVINAAGWQRTLSQRIGMHTLRAIDGDTHAVDQLRAAAYQFDRALKGLRNGDAEIGLPPAPGSVIPQLDLIDEKWGPVYRNIQIVEETGALGGWVLAVALSLVEKSEALSSSNETVVVALENAGASRPTVTLAGQQRILSQRMAKLALHISQGNTADAPLLAKDAQRFDEVIQLLLNGDPAQGVPVSTDITRERLLAMQEIWEPVYTDIQNFVAASDSYGEGVQAARAVVASSDALLRASDRAVELFQQEAQDKVTWMARFVVGTAVVFLLVFGVVLLTTRHAILPLTYLSRAAARVATGDMSEGVNVQSRDEIGMLASAFGHMTDQLRESYASLEQRVEERTAELAAANQELESFSYSVSHDLRAPLRGVDGFSQALLEDYGDKVDEQGQNYLNRIRAASQRMGQLIDDMLNLSRVTRTEMHREEVDLSSMARTIAAELSQSDPERDVEFVIGEGAVVTGDLPLLRAVMENLLENAWKYTSKHPRAKIEFGITRDDGRPAYFVRDDGAGFDMAYADNLFGAFQRLHGATEFEGTGIGLATVQRILHRHGGSVWAEGAVEKGATFYFTLN